MYQNHSMSSQVNRPRN